jgi:hypothetical protein
LMTRSIIAILNHGRTLTQACRIQRMTMRFGRGASCILPALFLLGVWALPASATDQLAPPQKPAKVIPLPKQPPRSHTIKIAPNEPLPTVVRCIPLILGIAY